MQVAERRLFCSDGSVSQSQDDSIVGTRQCRHSLAIMPIPGTLSSSSPDLLQPTTSILDFSNPSGKSAALASFTGWLQGDWFSFYQLLPAINVFWHLWESLVYWSLPELWWKQIVLVRTFLFCHLFPVPVLVMWLVHPSSLNINFKQYCG